MCGFAGELRFDGAPDREALRAMSAVLAPRGPDGAGEWVHDGIGLTHRRLAIIDLSDAGAQPMVSGDLAIAFNGIVYNHRELRAELERDHGARFDSHADTEVLLHGWRAWGEGVLDRLKGMFAFALADTTTGELVLARDRLGVKPLYLAEVDGALRFASTLPALLAGGGVDTGVDPVALHHYLSLHAIVPPPRTILRGVGKLEPATVVRFGRDGRELSRRRYWDPPFARDDADTHMTADDWAAAPRGALNTAVERRMVSDVPVGVLLSGGLDSSIIVGLLAEQGQRGLQTFSVGFGDAGGREGNEFRYSRMVAERFGTEHHTFEVGAGRLVDALPRAIGAMSEPMVSHDTVAFWLLSEAVVGAGLKVVQSGQGADEVLAGYSWYPPMVDAAGTGADAYRAAFLDRPHDELVGLLGDGWALDDDPTARLVERWFTRGGADTPVDRALRIDTEVMLVDDPVKRVDTMTMAHGLEARTPFLDHDLVELAARCPPEHKLAHGGKGVLKDAARGLVPDAVIDREKGYFPVPALSHLEEPVLTMVREALHAPAARARGLFRPDVVERMLEEPNAHRTNLDGSTLWQLALLELWLQHHVG